MSLCFRSWCLTSSGVFAEVTEVQYLRLPWQRWWRTLAHLPYFRNVPGIYLCQVWMGGGGTWSADFPPQSTVILHETRRLSAHESEKMPPYWVKELVLRIFAVWKYVLRTLSLAGIVYSKCITEIDVEPLHFSRRFLSVCGNREPFWTCAALGQQGDSTD